MNFKDMLAKMSQLSEATEKTKTGVKHTGSYGKDYDTDEEGNEKKKATSDEKKGRGRPKKDDSEEGKKYDTKSVGDVFGAGKKPSKEVGTVSKKNTLKDWFERLDTAINEGETTKTKTGLTHKGSYGSSYETDEEGNEKSAEKKGRGRPTKDAGDTKFDTSNLNKAMSGKLKEAEQIQIKPASQMPKKPGQTSQPGQQQQMAGQPAQNTQVIAQGDKTLGTVNNPQLAQQIKQSIGKGEMTLMPEEQLDELSPKTLGNYVKKAANDKAETSYYKGYWDRADGGSKPEYKDMEDKVHTGQEKRNKGIKTAVNKLAQKAMAEGEGNWIKGAIKKPGAFTKKAKSHGMSTSEFANKVMANKEDYPAKTEKQASLAKTLKKISKKTNEAEIPSHDGDMGAGLGAGRSQGMLEAKKPDANKNGIPDYAEDGKGKNDLKKKTKVKEGMDSRMKAAHHLGKAHALSKEAYNCKFDDLEEARMYHEGYKIGLDECHGQMPIQGYVGENDTEVDDMASFGAHTPSLDEDEFEEGNAFTRKLATTPAGGSFSLGGKSFKDTSGYDSSVFESWDKQLGALLLAEYNTIQEGLTVSISKGQQGAPDSVSVNAQDGEADQLLQFIKQAGLGIFGGEDQAQVGTSSPMSVATDGEPDTAEIGVVGDHDGMMDLIKKVTDGQQAGPAQGFGNEEHDHDHEHTDEETCNECGMMECDCDTPDGKEKVDEVESEDQMEYEVAEDNAPDSGAADTAIEVADDQEANASGAAYDAAEDEEQVEESYANGADDTFESDIDFMTKVISGGLNKQKSTGQTTIPVVASQLNRTVSESKMINESVSDWKTLAGIK